MKTGDGATTIGRGATLRGDLVSSEDVVVEGSIEGSLQAAGARVTIGKDARVRADVTAQEVIVEGRVDGMIRATERVELRSTAVVLGNVFAKRFAMEQEAMLRGNVDPTQPSEAPKVVAQAAPTPRSFHEPAPAASLFGAVRPAGQLPSGLAAAARGFGAGTPAGMSALSEEGGESPQEHPAEHGA